MHTPVTRVAVFPSMAGAPASARQALVNLDWAPHRSGGQLVPLMANVISPEATDDGKVTFRVKAPRAQEMLLAARTIDAALGRTPTPVPFTRGEGGLLHERLLPNLFEAGRQARGTP